ncbi:hypothetical protein J3A83DRAFT_4378381 [Scleroderma citrinum]
MTSPPQTFIPYPEHARSTAAEGNPFTTPPHPLPKQLPSLTPDLLVPPHSRSSTAASPMALLPRHAPAVPSATSQHRRPPASVNLIFLQSTHSTPSPSEDDHPSTPAISINEFIGYVQVFNNLKSWSALRWRAYQDHKCLRMLSNIFRDTKRVAERVSRKVLAAVSGITPDPETDAVMGNDDVDTMKIQSELVTLTHKLYGLALLVSFDSFLREHRGDLIVEVDVLSTSSTPNGSVQQPPIRSLHGPGSPGTPLLDNPILASHLQDLAYIHAALAMASSIATVTSDSQAKWSRFFMAIKQDPTTHGLYNATTTISPIPNQAFLLVVASPALCYYLMGKKDVPQDSPLYPYRCYKCN